MKIGFTVPADFKTESIMKMKELEKKYPDNYIREVFGNISGSVWPSGHGFLKRQHYVDTLEELSEYITAAAEAGYDYNYTFNAECLNNHDISQPGLSEILEFVGKLMDVGVKRITIASPALMIAVHKMYPDLKITASSITNIDSVIRAIEMEKLGVDTIVYGEDVTRNFQIISAIANSVSMSTEIIANSKCTFNCAYRVFHYCSVNHDMEGKRSVFSYTGNCALERYQNPVELIKSLWIRPEDIDVYARYGVNLIKLIGREQLSHINLLKMIEVYFSRDYDGNLMDLIFGFDMSKPHRYIDNKKLDGFLDKFIEEPFDCLSKCTSDQCQHCQQYLEKSWVNSTD